MDFLNRIGDKIRAAGGGVPDERRKLVRRRFVRRVRCTPADGGKIFGRVRDMSLDGLRLELPERVSKGAALEVADDDEGASLGEPVRCVVQWCRRKKSGAFGVGTSYLDGQAKMARSWVKAALTKAGFESGNIRQRRRQVRTPAGFRAWMDLGTGEHVEGTVIDLSAGGACFLARRPLPRGERVSVRIGPHGRLEPVELPADILEVRPGTQEGWRHGLTFTDMGLTRQGQLGFYINALLKEQEDT